MKSFIAYHGTLKTTANNIIRTSFTINRASVGWLGTGTYFFEGNSKMADSWVRYKYPGNITEVLECEIQVPEDKVFDVTIPGSKDNIFFHEFRSQLIQQELKRRGANINVRNNEDLDGKIYNAICLKLEYLLVRAYTYTFTEQDRQLRNNSRVPNGIELCLKNPRYVNVKSSVVV